MISCAANFTRSLRSVLLLPESRSSIRFRVSFDAGTLFFTGCSFWIVDSNAANVQTEGCIPSQIYSKFKTSPS